MDCPSSFDTNGWRLRLGMRTLAALCTWIALTSIGSLPVFAQDVPVGEVFLGATKVSGSSASAHFACNPQTCVVETVSEARRHYDRPGLEVSIAGNLNTFASIEAEAFCCQKPEWPISNRQTSFLAGPRFSVRRHSRLNPFVHMLFGITYGSQPVSLYHTAFRGGLTTGAGGGLDVGVTRYFWIRAFQADYFRESFRDDVQRNTNLSLGVVYRFGHLPTHPKR